MKRVKMQWTLDFLYSGVDDPKGQKDIQKVHTAISSFAKKRNVAGAVLWQQKKGVDMQLLLQSLQEYEALFAMPEQAKFIAYVWLRQSLALQDTKLKALMNQLEEQEREMTNQLYFFELAIGKIAVTDQKKILSDRKFAFCKHFLECIFAEAKHHLSEPEEKILRYVGKMAYSNWIRMTEEFISKEEMPFSLDTKQETKSFEELLALQRHIDPAVRKRAAKQIYAILDKHIDVGEHEFNTVLEYKKTMDQLRGYSRPDEATHLHDDVDAAFVDSLISAVSKRYDIAHRVYALKAKLLGKKKLQYYERGVPVGDVEKKVSFQQGVGYVRNAFHHLSPTFTTILENFLQQGYIDVFPRKGKRPGAFNIGFAKNMQNFVLLNRTDTISDVTTFAHEMGHAIHTTLSAISQNSLQHNYSLAVAEVASTFMEDFALQEIAKELSTEEQLLLYVETLDATVATIFRQTAFYLFEREIHAAFRERGYVDKKTIGEIYLKHMKAYMGPAVQFDPQDDLTRLYVSHFRRYFYVYSYVSGLLIAKSLQKKVKADPTYVQSVISFLSAGSSASPVAVFKQIGVDPTQASFWNDGLDEVEELLQKVEKMVKN